MSSLVGRKSIVGDVLFDAATEGASNEASLYLVVQT